MLRYILNRRETKKSLWFFFFNNSLKFLNQQKGNIMLLKLLKKIDSFNSPLLKLLFLIGCIEIGLLIMNLSIGLPIAEIIRLLGVLFSGAGIGLVLWRNSYRITKIDKIDKEAIHYIIPILSGIFAFLITGYYISQKVLIFNNFTILTVLGILLSTYGVAFGVLCENTKPSKPKAQFVIFTPLVIGLILSLINLTPNLVYTNLVGLIAIILLIAYGLQKFKHRQNKKDTKS